MNKPYHTVVSTACDIRYLPAVRELIKSINRLSPDCVDRILVYSVGLTKGGVQLLNKQPRTTVMPFPPEPFPGYLDPVQKSYKPFAIWDPHRVADVVIWLDAAMVVLNALNNIVDHIERTGAWLVRMPGVQNRSQCGPGVIKTLGIDEPELAAPVIASGHMGYLATPDDSTPCYRSLFEAAWLNSRIKEATQFRITPDYSAYRHDQPLYTTLAHRCQAPTVPLTHPELGAMHVSSRKDGRPWPSIQEARASGRLIYAHRQTAPRDLRMVLSGR